MSAVLQTRDITKSFRDGRESVPVLKGISFSLEAGEIVALEGPSGSGKTTFLSIAGCILTPSTGELSVDGHTINASGSNTLAGIRKRSLGFVFQQFNLFPSLTALENVEYALGIRGMRGDEAHAEAERVIAAVGLTDRSSYLPRDLSGGQKQRVAIARALAGRAPILLADEPTANLDYQSGTEILQLFRNLAREEQRALLIVTHDPKVRHITDRVVEIRDGRLVA